MHNDKSAIETSFKRLNASIVKSIMKYRYRQYGLAELIDLKTLSTTRFKS